MAFSTTLRIVAMKPDLKEAAMHFIGCTSIIKAVGTTIRSTMGRSFRSPAESALRNPGNRCIASSSRGQLPGIQKDVPSMMMKDSWHLPSRQVNCDTKQELGNHAAFERSRKFKLFYN